MGRPPSNGSPAFRFNLAEVIESLMDVLFVKVMCFLLHEGGFRCSWVETSFWVMFGLLLRFRVRDRVFTRSVPTFLFVKDL